MAKTLNHTLSAIRIIKRELSKIKKVLNIGVQIAFVLYCLYLIFSNFDSLPYIIIYSFVLVLSLVTTMIEPFYKIDENDQKNVKRQKKKHKRVVFIFIKSLKYLFKLVAISIAIYEIATKGATDLSILATIGSGVLLLIQVIYDSITMLVNRYMDLLQIAVEEDIRGSKMMQFVLNFNHKDYVQELKDDEKTYTDEEKKLLWLLENADRLEEEKKNNKIKVKATPVNKDMLILFSDLKRQASSMLESKKERKKFIKEMDELQVPTNIKEYEKVPSLVEFVKSYKKKKFSYIDQDKASSAAASLIYIAKKKDIAKEKDKHFDESDDQVIIKKSLEDVNQELNQFNKEKEKKHHFFSKKD